MGIVRIGPALRLVMVVILVGLSALVVRARGVGSVDPTFTPSIELSEGVSGWSLEALAVYPDGRILVAGAFSAIGGVETIGIYRNGAFFLRNSNGSGFVDLQFPFGAPGDIAIAGDWNGDGVDTIGIVRGKQWFLRNSNTSGFADIQFTHGTDTDIPIVGNWDGLP